MRAGASASGASAALSLPLPQSARPPFLGPAQSVASPLLSLLRAPLSWAAAHPPALLPSLASSLPAFLPDRVLELLGAALWQYTKRTYQPSVVRKKRTHGFLARNATTSGQKLLGRRRRKGRANLAP